MCSTPSIVRTIPWPTQDAKAAGKRKMNMWTAPFQFGASRFVVRTAQSTTFPTFSVEDKDLLAVDKKSSVVTSMVEGRQGDGGP
jgi:hypothetical protein